MDACQLEKIILRVLERIRVDSTSAMPLPEAYVILPEDWRGDNNSHCIRIIETLNKYYRTTAVLPYGDESAVSDFKDICMAVTRFEDINPQGEFVTVFPTASRSRVVKTALCLEDDFESKWIARCISLGQAVYMPKEAPMLTGLEPGAYIKKIEGYYREAEAFGIRFDKLPPGFVAGNAPVQPAVALKKRIITSNDLNKLQGTAEIRLRSGDILTALAAEHAEELGISVIYE